MYGFQAFADQIVRDSELICVELVARDRYGTLQGVIFVSTIRYDVLKRVYDTRVSAALLIFHSFIHSLR